MMNEAAIEICQTFRKRIASLERALETSKPGQMIFAWSDYGIGVLVKPDGPQVVGVELATICRASDRRAFNNGHKVPAALMCRATAIRAALALTRNTLANIERRAA